MREVAEELGGDHVSACPRGTVRPNSAPFFVRLAVHTGRHARGNASSSLVRHGGALALFSPCMGLSRQLQHVAGAEAPMPGRPGRCCGGAAEECLLGVLYRTTLISSLPFTASMPCWAGRARLHTLLRNAAGLCSETILKYVVVAAATHDRPSPGNVTEAFIARPRGAALLKLNTVGIAEPARGRRSVLLRAVQ